MRKVDVVAVLRTQLQEARATVERLHHAVLALERLNRQGRRRAESIAAVGHKRIADAQKAKLKKILHKK